MPRHTVKLLSTIGACSALALVLSNGADAVEVEVNTPHINVPTPRVNVPKPHITVPTVNLRHHRQSTDTNTLTNKNKLNATTTTVNTPFVGPSNGGGSAGAKIIIESVGGSGTPTQVQRQNAAAAAAAAAAAIGSASSGAGSPGEPAKTWNPSLANPIDGEVRAASPVKSANLNLPTAQSTAAFYNSLAAGADNAAYAADVSALQAPVTAAQDSAACATNPNGSQCLGAVSAAATVRNDFEAYVDYLLLLLGFAENPDFSGYGFTPEETADIEAALQACLASPSTCAATIANLNAELASLGAPSGYQASGGSGWIQVIQTPAQIAAGWLDDTTSPNGNLSLSAELPIQVAIGAGDFEGVNCKGPVC